MPRSDEVLMQCSPSVFAFEGRIFTAGGTFMTEKRLFGAYLGKTDQGYECKGSTGPINDSKGNQIGTYLMSAVWPTPESHVASRRFWVVATVQGRRYQGSCWGVGMLFNGRRNSHELAKLEASQAIK